MKCLSSLGMVLPLVALGGPAFALNGGDPGSPFLSMAKFGMTVEQVKVVKSVTGERERIIKASRRDSQLIEVKLRGTAHAAGEFGLYPTAFSVICKYRRVSLILPSLAFGRKRTLKSGDVEEYWLNEPGVTMILGCEKGEAIVVYVLFEVPKECDECYVQVPAVLAKLPNR